MQQEQASRTALLIAASLVLLHCEAKYSRLISKTSADLCAHVLDEEHSAKTRLFRGAAKIVTHRAELAKRAGPGVPSTVQRISGPETKVQIPLNVFRAIGIATIASFSQVREFFVMSATADSSCGELSDALQRNAKREARLSNISEFSGVG